jgi:hypothetical protein
MAGTPENASVWAQADVYTAPVGTAGPADTWSPWAAPWAAVGLLNGDEGFTEAREDETAEHYAWGGILVKRTKSKHKRTIKFVALEDNDVVFALVNPGSERDDTTDPDLVVDTIRVPVSAEVALGFETRDGEKIKRRVVDRAEISDVDEIKDSESEMTAYGLTATLYPASNGDLYTTITGPDTAPTP